MHTKGLQLHRHLDAVYCAFVHIHQVAYMLGVAYSTVCLQCVKRVTTDYKL